MARKFATANTPQAVSGQLRRSNAIARMANCLDRRAGTQLLAQAPDAYVHDVGARIEVVAPDFRQQPLAADHLALVLEQMVEHAKLAVGKLNGRAVQLHLAAGEIEHEGPGPENLSVLPAAVALQLDVDPGDQLVE